MAAAILLVFLVAGIPAALLAMGADPRNLLPDRWPALTDVRHWPEQGWQALRFAYQDGSLVRGAMLIILWGTWSLLAWMVIAEIVVQLRGGAAATSRRYSTVNPRRWIAGVVTAALVLVSSGSVCQFPTLGPRAVAAVHYVPPSRDAVPIATSLPVSARGQDAGHLVAEEHRETVAAKADPTWVDPTVHPKSPRITVVHGDTMWDLARLHLGNGRRWSEINELNRDRIPDPHWLQAGWVLLLPADAVNLAAPAADPGPDARKVAVQPEETLSSIAVREYGNSNAWPTLYAANRHRLQPDGRALRNPDLILPGWILIVPTNTPGAPATPTLPSDPPASAQPPPQPPVPPGTTTPATPSGAKSQAGSTDTTRDSSGANDADDGPATRWAEAFVGLGLAAAISAALLMARRRFRRTYRPGTGRRDDLAVAPVVHRLRVAHLRAAAGTGEDDDRATITTPPTLVIGSGGTVGEARPDNPPAASTVGLGVRDGREIALNLAAARGLGLVGAGAAAAARALLLALLTTDSDTAQTQLTDSAANPAVLVPRDDLAILLGWRYAPTDLPARLRVVPDLNTALNELDAEIQRRSRHYEGDSDARESPLALVASPPEDSTRRLQDLLENGASVGILGVLLGQWQPGITAHIRTDGHVSATNPGIGEALEGTRMFHLSDSDTADLLALLHQAQPGNPTVPHDDQRAPAPSRAFEHPPPPPDAPHNAPTSSPPAAPTTAHNGGDVLVDDTKLEVAAIPNVRDDDRVADGLPTDHSTGQPDRPADAGPSSGSTTNQATSPIAIRVLGGLQVLWRPGTGDTAVDRDITTAFAPRQRELLVALAVRPGGVHRDRLLTTIWLNTPPNRPTNALNTALTRMRRAVAVATENTVTNLIVAREGRYQLDSNTADVDYWRFSAAVSASHTARRDQERIAALRQAVDTYTGRLVEAMDTEWLDAIREATNRDALDAVAALARAVVDTDPEYTLDLLETARTFAPHNESIYRDIMRLQKRLGRLDAIPRTLNLLNKHLAEINEQATPESIALASRLQNGGRHAPLEVGIHLLQSSRLD